MEERKEMAGQQRCFFASSSMLRLCADTKTTRIDAIPGARVGHVANHVSNDADLFKQAKVVAIHAGGNMDYGSPEASKPHSEAQALEMEKVVKPLVEAEKKVFFIDPVAGKIPEGADMADHWAMVRSRMRKTAKKTKSTWISLNDLDWVPEEDTHEDRVHYTESGTKKVMEKVRVKIQQETGIDVMEGMEIVARPYSGMFNRHYKFGCYRCTRLHDHGPCPSLPECVEDSDCSYNDSSISDITEMDEGAKMDEGAVTDFVSDDPIRRNSICVDDSMEAATPPKARVPTGRVATTASLFSSMKNRSKDRSTSASKRARETTEDSPDKAMTKDKKVRGPNKQGNGQHSKNGNKH